MSLTRHDRPLDQLLNHMAEWKPEHRAALAGAATAVRAIFNTDRTGLLPRVLTTTGWDADPVVTEVGNLASDVDRMRDDLAVLGDRLDDIARLLKKPAAQTAATSAGATS